MMKVLLISPCHTMFGGWYRAKNIEQALLRRNSKVGFLYNKAYLRNPFKRFLVGMRNAFNVLRGGYDVIHVFELVQLETLLPALAAKLFRKRVVLDVGDEWLHSPTYLKSGLPIRSYIRFFDLKVTLMFGYLTVTSDHLLNKFKFLARKRNKSILKLVNGVNKQEYLPLKRLKARKILGISPHDKVILSFGNTYEGRRRELLLETYEYVKNKDKSIHLFWGKYLNKEDLPVYIGYCDLLLFPTGDDPSEKSCFPIRIGTYLNGERVIATDDSDTEFHNTLAKFNCLLTGKDPEDLANNIIRFFNDYDFRHRLENNTLNAKHSLDWDNLIVNLEEFYAGVK